MSEPRREHTATLLDDGRVLISGGTNFNSALGTGSYLRTVELFNPETRLWTPAAPMHERRVQHTGTLLADGTVLVVGGQNDSIYPPISNPTPTAELYDTSTDSWALVDSLGIPRYTHTATLLPDGRVLIVGGIVVSGGATPTASAEIYDPSTQMFAPTGAMNTARFGHAATVLSDGRVLVVGGNGGGGYPSLRSAEIYDPETGAWSVVGDMSIARGGGIMSATLLPNGSVLVLGGSGSAPFSAELFDPSTQSFTFASSSQYENAYATVALPDGRVLVTGGLAGNESTVAAQAYDPSSDTWTAGPPMLQARTHHSATRLADGTIVIAGGLVGFSGTLGVAHTSSAEILTGIDTPPTLTLLTQQLIVLSNDAAGEDARLRHMVVLAERIGSAVQAGRYESAITLLTALTSAIERAHARGIISSAQREQLVNATIALKAIIVP